MKTKNLFIAMLIFIISSNVFAQSDYATLQSFKKQYKQIEQSIKNASSLDDWKMLDEQVTQLRNDFAVNKEMLDKALYPENFNSSFDKLSSEIESKKNDFNRIGTLTTQITGLQTEVSTLNQKNEELIKQIEELKVKSDKNETQIAELKRLVGLLRSNIDQRDLLVRDLVDSLLVEFIKTPQNIGPREAKTIVSKVKRQNLFYNIERTIADNIQFTKVTQMTPEDFAQMKKQYNDFAKVWRKVGPRLSGVYLSTKQKKSEIPQIDSLFIQWNNQIDAGIWKGVYDQFAAKNINVDPFSNGETFVGSLTSYIDNEIRMIDTKSHDVSVQEFHNFADDVYSSKIETKWIPILIENKMLTQAEKSSIDMKLEAWSSKVSFSTPYWVFILAGIVVVAAIFFLLKRSRKRSTSTESVPT